MFGQLNNPRFGNTNISIINIFVLFLYVLLLLYNEVNGSPY